MIFFVCENSFIYLYQTTLPLYTNSSFYKSITAHTFPSTTDGQEAAAVS